MEDKNLIVKKDNIFSKIIGKIRNFFCKNKNDIKYAKEYCDNYIFEEDDLGGKKC